MAWTLYEGDCLEVMKTLPSESVDAIITDVLGELFGISQYLCETSPKG